MIGYQMHERAQIVQCTHHRSNWTDAFLFCGVHVREFIFWIVFS